MAHCEERRRRHMSIFRDFSTKQWAILVKSLRDVQMASISKRKPLGKATSLPGAPFGPTCSPFGRLDGAVREYGPLASFRRGAAGLGTRANPDTGQRGLLPLTPSSSAR